MPQGASPIERLMLRWQDSRARGAALSAEELCRDAPELLPELRQRIAAMEAGASRRSGRVDFFMGTSPDSGDDTRRILRPRLFWASAAFLILFILDIVYEGFVAAAHPRVGIGCALGIVIVFVALLFGVLGRSRDLGLRELRVIELALVVLVALYLALYQVGFVVSGRLEGLVEDEHASEVFTFYLDSMVLPWVVLILVYGTYIPNAWRRTAAVVGMLAAVPLALAVMTTLGEVGPEHLSSIAWSTCVWLGLATPLAVYGAHRIDTARQKELEARLLGQYRLVRKLGEGGMGEVHLAEHQWLRRPCAVKLIRPDRGGDPRRLLRFEREVHAMASLRHANVVDVYDYGQTRDGTFYYVMEYLQGLDLDALVNRHGPLPSERAVYLLRQVCAGLRAAHRAGLIHRDIKPGNILLCQRGDMPDVVKLVDFGLVCGLGDADDRKLTQDGAVVGTPLFMAPEQIAGAAELDGRTDLYSVGVVAYFLLTGRNPFDRATLREVFAAHLREPPVPPRTFTPAIPVELEALVLRCLAKSPADRPADAEALDKGLAACVLGEAWTEARAAEWWAQHHAEDDSTPHQPGEPGGGRLE